MRGLTSSGTRYLSIDAGATNLVDLNQDPGGDFGDWLSGPCPQVHPYVQIAFSCPDQLSDVTQTSPEGVNLGVIGYDLITSVVSTTTTALHCAWPAGTCSVEPASKKQRTAACSPIVTPCKTSCAGVRNVRKCKKRCRAAIVGRCKRGRPPACS